MMNVTKRVYRENKRTYNKMLISDRKKYFDRINHSVNKSKCFWQIKDKVRENITKWRSCQIDGGLQKISNSFNKFIIDLSPKLVSGIPENQKIIRYKKTT